MNNLILFSNIKPNKILEISKLCELDFIDNDLLRYDYMIEENGNNLSGGQKQRLVLARALLKNSNIYLLDEALNQVDHNMERNILLNMFDKYKTKTIIYVSHKDNNKDLFNKHFVLENGYLYENS